MSIIQHKIQDYSAKLLNFALEAVRNNEITHKSNEYYCPLGEDAQIVIAFNNSHYLIFIKQDGEDVFFTFNKSTKKVMLFNTHEVDCSEIFNNIINIIREKNRC